LRFVVVLAMSAIIGCNPPAPSNVVPGVMANEGAVVMTVDGKPFHQNQLDAILENVPAPQLEAMKAQGQLGQLLDQIAMTNALYEKAIADKLHEKPNVKVSLALAERQALAQAYVMEMASAAVTDAAVQAWYDERKVQFAKPEVSARHILVKEESLANDLKAQLDAGADFAALATANSTDTGSAVKGGDLGWFTQDKMVPAFAEAAFAANAGDIVGPVSTRFGFHIIKVEQKRDSTPLSEVRPQAEDAIKQETMRAFTNELKTSMKVEKMGEYADKTPPPIDEAHGGAPGVPPNHPPTGTPAPAPADH
jgi:peptidyl-prolyl cis-trans isomerase C